jgi:NADH-ubiquinone oxidoreductase chain 4
MYGSYNKVRASFYLFLYTLFGSLFLLLSILNIITLIGSSDFTILFKSNLNYITQLILFCGIFIAFAVKTPVIFLNN